MLRLNKSAVILLIMYIKKLKKECIKKKKIKKECIFHVTQMQICNVSAKF